MNWVIIAMLAPALYAASSFIDRFLIEKKIKDTLFLTILGGATAFLAALVILIIKGFPVLGGVNLFLLIFSGILFELALLPYYRAISLADTSRVVPLFQMIPVFVLIMSFIFLNEIPGRNQLVGFFLVLAGAFILSLEEAGLKNLRLGNFTWFVLLSAFLYAVPSVIFKYVVVEENFWDTLAYEFVGGGIGAAILMFWWYLKNKDLPAEISLLTGNVWAIIVSNEIIYIGARFLSFYAITLAPVYLVSVLGGTGPFFVFIYGVILSVWFPRIIKEDLRKPVLLTKLSAIALMFAGVYLINL